MIEEIAKILIQIHSSTLVFKLLLIKKSNFYRHQKPQTNTRKSRNEELSALIKEIYDQHKGIYGAPRIYQELIKQGESCSLKRVQKLMKKQGLKAIVTRKWKHSRTDQTADKPEYINLLNQDFSASELNQKWSTDITYIYTKRDGWCYLSSIMDLCSRKIIGWKFSKRMTNDLVLDTLKLVEA